MNLGDSQDFSRAYDEHHRSVYLAAHRVLADHALACDVVQDVFLRLWRRPRAFDASRGDLGTFLRMMARSRAIDLLREGQTRGRASDRLKLVVSGDAGREALRADVPGETLERDVDREVVRAALKELPVAQREALVLAYWGGLTAEQIATSKKIPLGTAKSRIRLGMAKLRTDLDPAPAAA